MPGGNAPRDIGRDRPDLQRDRLLHHRLQKEKRRGKRIIRLQAAPPPARIIGIIIRFVLGIIVGEIRGRNELLGIVGGQEQCQIVGQRVQVFLVIDLLNIKGLVWLV